MTVRMLLVTAACLALTVASCSSGPKPSQLSGKVTFKGQPVPAGWISFTPDVAAGGTGQVKVFQIKDGVYDSSKEDPPGLPPGVYMIRVAGFDGKKIPFYGQGKQVFNEVGLDKYTVPPGATTKDWVVPESAGQNIRYDRTADS